MLVVATPPQIKVSASLGGVNIMQYRALGATGIKLSLLGFGGSGYGKVYGHYDEKAVMNGLHYGLDCGINYIDTAPWYGQGVSEMFIGKALKGINRSKFYIGTKVGRYERDISSMFDFSAKSVFESAEKSICRLNVDYLDLLQVHDVEFAPSMDIIINETLPALEQLKKQGLCRFIGITGYPLSVLRSLTETSNVCDTVLSYCRLTLNDSSLTRDLDYYNSRGIGLINASPMGMGLLAPETIQFWHPANEEIKRVCSEAVKYCESQNIDIARIALNYSTSFEQVATTLVSMTDREMIKKNIEATLLPLSDKEKEVIDTLQRKYFKKLSSPHWEGVEVQEYWKELSKAST